MISLFKTNNTQQQVKRRLDQIRLDDMLTSSGNIILYCMNCWTCFSDI